MPTYTYKCVDESCNHTFDICNVLYVNRDNVESFSCLKCGGSVKRIMHSTTFQIAEIDGPCSAKSHTYWENAERNKQKDIKKRQDDRKEKEFYENN